jgi:hypothetical protein
VGDCLCLRVKSFLSQNDIISVSDSWPSLLQKEIAFVSKGGRPCLRDTLFFSVPEGSCICLKGNLLLRDKPLFFVPERQHPSGAKRASLF